MSVTANLTTNVETITATIVVEDETIIAEINTAARGPAGPAGGGSSSITSATTSDGTADLSLSNVTTATATVSGTLTADHIHGNLAGNVYGHVRAGETLAKGDPVYVSGSHGSGSTLIPIVSRADASNAGKMPAVGIMDAAVANNASGHMVIIGTITELNTVGYSINAELYVAAGGGLAVTPPTGRAQPVARVERANGTNGAIIVKVNGLSASAATANTLVLRDASGGAQFSDLVASTSFDAGMFAVDPLVGSTFEAGSSIAFNSTAYTYGTGAASAHRIALGAGTTGATLFGAATAAAARATLGLADKSITKIVECECFSNTTPGAGEFASGAVNGGSCINSGLANANHPGVIAFRDAATTANSGFRMTALSDSIIIGGGELAVSVFNLRSARSTQTVRFGILETTDNTTPTKGVWLEMVGNGTGVVITGKTVNGGAITSSGTTYTAAVSTWYSARIELTSASSATFTVYNASGTSLWTDTIATAVPTGATGFGIIAYDASADGPTVMLDLDYIRFEINRTLTR
jgi:hypothetical protein